MTGDTRRAVLYARKSTKQDRSEEQSASVEDQLRLGREYAQRRGWVVVDQFNDDGRSGRLDRSKRPGLDKALGVVESRRADTLITLWTSRLSRDPLQWFEYLNVLDDHGVEWHATAEGGLVDRRTATTRFTTNMRGMMNAYQSDLIGENWKRVHDRRLGVGLPKTTNPQFGYDYDHDFKTMISETQAVQGRYVINENEADVVRDLYRRYARAEHRGEGFTQLVTWLNDQGWRVKGTGNRWSVRTLGRWMDSGFAAGFISKEAHLRDTVKGAHTPLITEAEWLAYRAQRDRQRGMAKKASGAGTRWWLAGFVRCGSCGASTYVNSFRQEASLVCCSGKRHDPDSCQGSSILRAYVENAVGLWLLPHLDQLDQLRQHEARDNESTSAAAYQEAVAERDRITEALAGYEVKRALADIPASVYQRAHDELMARHRAAEAAVKQAAAAMIGEPGEVDTDALRAAASNGWTADDRAALHGVLDRVEVGRDALTIYPVSGDPVVRSRKDLRPACAIAGCGRKVDTRGICRSHAMRARNLGVLDQLAAMVAEARAVTSDDGVSSLAVTEADVVALFAKAAEAA